MDFAALAGAAAALFYGLWQRSKRVRAEEQADTLGKELKRHADATKTLVNGLDEETRIREAVMNDDDLKDYFK